MTCYMKGMFSQQHVHCGGSKTGSKTASIGVA